jgi:hypothetical protein
MIGSHIVDDRLEEAKNILNHDGIVLLCLVFRYYNFDFCD